MPDQGETYAKFIEAELKAEYERRTALDARALTVATVSAAFIALATAFAAYTFGKDYQFSQGGARGLVASLVSFLLASVLASIAHGSRKYHVTDGATLTSMLSEPHWMDSEPAALNTTSTLNVKTIKALRTGNNGKAGQLVVAHVFQLLAVGGLILSLGYELRESLL